MNSSTAKCYGKVEQIKDRIVSLSKAYVRPIVEAKKQREWSLGAKVNPASAHRRQVNFHFVDTKSVHIGSIRTFFVAGVQHDDYFLPLIWYGNYFFYVVTGIH